MVVGVWFLWHMNFHLFDNHSFSLYLFLNSAFKATKYFCFQTISITYPVSRYKSLIFSSIDRVIFQHLFTGVWLLDMLKLEKFFYQNSTFFFIIQPFLLHFCEKLEATFGISNHFFCFVSADVSVVLK